MHNLELLSLSFNEIRVLNGISKLSKLRMLDVSDNQLVTIDVGAYFAVGEPTNLNFTNCPEH